MCHAGTVLNQQMEGAMHMTVTTLGIDIAKSVFQLHGVDLDGTIVLQSNLRRSALLDVLCKLAPA
jgi:transposase